MKQKRHGFIEQRLFRNLSQAERYTGKEVTVEERWEMAEKLAFQLKHGIENK